MKVSLTSNRIDCSSVLAILKGVVLEEAERILIDRFIDKITDSSEYSVKFHEELRRLRFNELSKEVKLKLIEKRDIIELGTDPSLNLQLRPEGTTNWAVYLGSECILDSLSAKTALKVTLDINVIGNIFTNRVKNESLN